MAKAPYKEYFLEFESRNVRKWISPYFVCFVDWYKKTLIFLFVYVFLLIFLSNKRMKIMAIFQDEILAQFVSVWFS